MYVDDQGIPKYIIVNRICKDEILPKDIVIKINSITNKNFTSDSDFFDPKLKCNKDKAKLCQESKVEESFF